MGNKIRKLCETFTTVTRKHVLIIGDSQSGKTTFLYGSRLKPGWDQQKFMPTYGYNFEEISCNGATLGVWDTPGEDALFPIVKTLYTHLKMQAIIFVFKLSNQPIDYIKARRKIKFISNEPALKDCELAVVVNSMDEAESQFQDEKFLQAVLGLNDLKNIDKSKKMLHVFNFKYQPIESKRVWEWLSEDKD